MLHKGYILSIVLIVLFVAFLAMVFNNKFCDRYEWFPIDLCYKASWGDACIKAQYEEIRRHSSM